ncbi:MAG: DUF3570 domain-containing protein [Steroidobacteraceae bacterium]
MLALSTQFAAATVLPEERADVMYHRYDGGDVTVDGPSVLVRKNIGEKLSVAANYYTDFVTSASIDVQTSASAYEETRNQYSLSADVLNGKAVYSLGYIRSSESDYQADTAYVGVSQSLFGDLTTISFGYRYGSNEIGRNVAGVLDPDFNEEMKTQGYTAGVSQILTRSMILALNFEVVTDEGFLRSPYRSVRFIDIDGSQALQSESYPNTRTSNAASLRGKYFLPWRAAAELGLRYYTDTWGVRSQTIDVGYTHPRGKWTFDGLVRYYQQDRADFYQDLFPRRNFANFLSRDKELATYDNVTLTVGASYEFRIPRLAWIDKSSASIRYSFLTVNYDDFRDATKSLGKFGVLPDEPLAPGAEPLYKLDASVMQVFFSIWF